MTWTQLDRDDVLVQSAYANTVYGTTGLDEGVNSTDGGRTWSTVRERPGGPGDWMVASELGYIAVETVIFGPCAGVVWISADDSGWTRALNTWPPPDSTNR